jgi:hypothetical protein
VKKNSRDRHQGRYRGALAAPDSRAMHPRPECQGKRRWGDSARRQPVMAAFVRVLRDEAFSPIARRALVAAALEAHISPASAAGAINSRLTESSSP